MKSSPLADTDQATSPVGFPPDVLASFTPSYLMVCRLGPSVTIALSSAISAAARYFSASKGDIDNTSAMLSKPYPLSSAGKSAAGLKSTPRRSRIVLLYSARFSRRIVTRPGSRGPVQSRNVTASFIKPVNSAFSASVGCGLSSGGMLSLTSWSAIFSHVGRSDCTAAKWVNLSRVTSPLCLPLAWQA